MKSRHHYFDSGFTRRFGATRSPNVPLGYDTSDFFKFAAQICDDAIAGRYRGAVVEKISEIQKILTITQKPRVILTDPAPVYLLSLAGKAGLDQLFIPKAPVWITDGVRYELLRDADNGAYGVQKQREILRAWFDDNEDRIRVKPTDEFENYRQEMQHWTAAGRPEERKPVWGKCSEVALKQTFTVLVDVMQKDEEVIFLSDGAQTRDLIYNAAEGRNALNAEVIGTIGFLKLAEEFGGQNSQAIWRMIRSKI